MIEPKIIMNGAGKRARLACWRRRLAVANFQNISALLNVDCALTNRAKKTLTGPFPMKDLSGRERLLEIKVSRGDFSQKHQ
jgi:hypothetical protein